MQYAAASRRHARTSACVHPAVQPAGPLSRGRRRRRRRRRSSAMSSFVPDPLAVRPDASRNCPFPPPNPSASLANRARVAPTLAGFEKRYARSYSLHNVADSAALACAACSLAPRERTSMTIPPLQHASAPALGVRPAPMTGRSGGR